VHGFFFGGMENVSATTLQEWALQDSQAAADYSMSETVAHELAQHWFGDYAQGRDWADIWLNEGFATYFPSLYTQYHEGNDAYRLQMLGYQDEAMRQDREDYLRPIVDHHYTDGMQMFDSITHEKGAAVLDMLRYVLDGSASAAHPATGQSRFFSALRHYLQSYAAQSTDTADLMKAMRDATGENLDWFFHEWVFMAGTPVYRLAASYDTATKVETVKVTQTQKGPGVPPVFDMPVEFAFHGPNGEVQLIQLRNDQADQTFTVPLAFEPLWVDFDPQGFIEKIVDFPQSPAALTAAAEEDPAMPARLWAVDELGKTKGADAEHAVTTLSRILAGDAFYGVRAEAAASLAAIGTPGAKQALLAGPVQADSRVRTSVADALSRFHGDADAYQALTDTLHADPSYAVRAVAAQGIGRSGMPDAFDVLQAALAAKPEVHVARALEAGLAATGDPRAVSVLLSYAQPGMPVRLRLSALAGLAAMQKIVERDHAEEFATLIGRTLHDPYFPLQQLAQGMVPKFHLMQFKPEIAAEATGAPTPWQRGTAQGVLDSLQAAPAGP